MVQQRYDFIIIGGGSAGCVLANRLSANPDHRVLVLEAGGTDHRWDFRIHMPAALTYPLTSTTYNWWYESEPEPFMNNRRIYQPRGKVLGGSSCINGMIYIRGNAMDYENWAKIEGLEQWAYANCLPYFQRVEYRLMGADDYHGVGGPLYLTTPECDNPLFAAFFEAVQQAGYPLTDDVNGHQQEGFGKFDGTIYRGRRWNAARAYVHPIKQRDNLELRCRSLATRILFEGQRATGVEVLRRGQTERVEGKEIICCGGSINSPQLLQLSGLGAAAELEALGIKAQLDLPGVGENLQDHLEVYVQYACKQPVSLFPTLARWRQPGIGFDWLFRRRGVGASNHFEAGGFIRGNDRVTHPNLQYHFLPIAIRYDGSAPAAGHGYQVHVGPMNTDVRGEVKICSKDPEVYPRVLLQLPLHEAGAARVGRGDPPHARDHDPAGLRPLPRRGAGTRRGGPVGRGDPRLHRPGGGERLPPQLHLQDGLRRAGGGGRRAAGARRRGAAGGGRLGDAQHHQRQHLRPGADDRREGRGPDPGQHRASTFISTFLPA